MPGPCNVKKTRKIQAQKAKARSVSASGETGACQVAAASSKGYTLAISPPQQSPSSSTRYLNALRPSPGRVNISLGHEQERDGTAVDSPKNRETRSTKELSGSKGPYLEGGEKKEDSMSTRPLPCPPSTTNWSDKSPTRRHTKLGGHSRTWRIALSMLDPSLPSSESTSHTAPAATADTPLSDSFSSLALARDAPLPKSPVPSHPPPCAPAVSARIQSPPSAMAPPRPPFIHDPGSGPRVTDFSAFLLSPFAAPPTPPSSPEGDYPNFSSETSTGEAEKDASALRALLATPEITQILLSVLPQEAALTLQYNRSRTSSRVCPACMRLYHVGEPLKVHFPVSGQSCTRNEDDEDYGQEWVVPSGRERREQVLSGLCSSMCFTVASYNYLSLTSTLYGRTEAELDDASWEALSGPGRGLTREADRGLGLLVRMSRMDDLGLEAMCFPAEAVGSGPSDMA